MPGKPQESLLIEAVEHRGELKMPPKGKLSRVEVDRLKRPFTRLDDSRAGAGGAGLGLAIVERVARAHGGGLELLPREGGGLVARLTLRL